MTELLTVVDADGVTVLCPTQEIGLRFEHFADSPREGPYAELTLHNLEPDAQAPHGWGLNGRVKRARLPLLSERSQSPIAKALAAVDHAAGRAPVDWAFLLESACNRAVDALRGLPPGVDLADVEAPLHRPWTLRPVLPLGEPTMVYADGESGKSLLALAISLSLVTGAPLLGTPPNVTGPVAYLDWEATEITHRRRLDSLCRGLGLPVPKGIHYQPMHAPLAKVGPSVRALLRRLGAVAAVVDSMGFAAEGDVMGPDGALGVFRALRGWSGTVLALHHMSKEEAAKEYGAAEAYGSIYFRNSVRMAWELRSHALPGGVRRVALYHRKDNDGERMTTPLGLEFTRDAMTETTRLRSFAVSQDVPLAKHGSLSTVLLGILLREGGKTGSELEEITGIPADKCADAMRHDTRFRRLEQGGGRGKKTQWGAASR